jgi:predicted dithiol-disulfide oxidoreductase (DUF899 family)
MSPHRIATQEEWQSDREQLLVREKEHTRIGDELARERRELPWVPVEKDYTFDTEDGTRTLAELFAGRSQLVVYSFMFGPDYEAGCPVCSSIADSFGGVLSQLRARDVEMIAVSRAPIEKLLAYRARMGWSFNWASSLDSDFNWDFQRSRSREEVPAWALDTPEPVAGFAAACGTDAVGYISEQPGLAVFARSEGEVYMTYTTGSRGLEPVMSYYGILDLVPRGRDGEPSDPGWIRRHDEFEMAR